MKRITTKPLKQGRYWWTDPQTKNAELVFIEQQSLGLYVLGKGWLPWQTGEFSGPVGDDEKQLSE